MKNTYGNIVYSRAGINNVGEVSNRILYSSKTESDIQPEERERKITNINSNSLSPITEYEIEMALKKMDRCQGEDGVLTILLKYGGRSLIKELLKLFIKCIDNEDISSDWTDAVVFLYAEKLQVNHTVIAVVQAAFQNKLEFKNALLFYYL